MNSLNNHSFHCQLALEIEVHSHHAIIRVYFFTVAKGICKTVPSVPRGEMIRALNLSDFFTRRIVTSYLLTCFWLCADRFDWRALCASVRSDGDTFVSILH